MTRTKGRSALAAWLGGDGRSQSALARQLGVRQSSISGWVRGTSRPEHHYRLALQRMVGIDPAAWMTSDEARIARPAEEVAG